MQLERQKWLLECEKLKSELKQKHEMIRVLHNKLSLQEARPKENVDTSSQIARPQPSNYESTDLHCRGSCREAVDLRSLLRDKLRGEQNQTSELASLRAKLERYEQRDSDETHTEAMYNDSYYKLLRRFHLRAPLVFHIQYPWNLKSESAMTATECIELAKAHTLEFPSLFTLALTTKTTTTTMDGYDVLLVPGLGAEEALPYTGCLDSSINQYKLWNMDGKCYNHRDLEYVTEAFEKESKRVLQ